jgi:hypothetical protein
MAKYIFQKTTYFILIFILLLGCKKEEVSPPDPILGNWEVKSVSGAGETVIWNDLKATLVDLIPEYECMEWTVAITEEIVTTNIILPDYDSNGCESAEVTVWTWERTKDSNEYTFTKGLIEISIYNINVSGSQMTWTDQFDGSITIWTKVE